MSTVPTLTTTQILIKAKTLLAERGWRQGNAGTEGGALCMAEAISLAAGNERFDDYRNARYAVEHLLGRSHLELWNDHPSRTLAEVNAALTLAAKPPNPATKEAQ